jgi:DNA sulfur modification protein DndC
MGTLSLFDSDRLSLDRSIELTVESLRAYGALYRHWAIAFSGGKDSAATVTLVADLLEQGAVPRPDSITVLYADTRQELPPLHNAALALLGNLRSRGFDTRIVLPEAGSSLFCLHTGARGAAAVEYLPLVYAKAEGDEHGAGTGEPCDRSGAKSF